MIGGHPQTGAAGPLINIQQLVQRLQVRTPLTFRAGNTRGYVEVVSFAGQNVEVVRSDVARVAIDWWLTQHIQVLLCQRN